MPRLDADNRIAAVAQTEIQPLRQGASLQADALERTRQLTQMGRNRLRIGGRFGLQLDAALRIHDTDAGGLQRHIETGVE